MDYRNSKGYVLLRSQVMGCFECLKMNRKGEVSGGTAPVVSYKPDKQAAITDMRSQDRTDIPASGWKKVSVDHKAAKTWHHLAQLVWNAP